MSSFPTQCRHHPDNSHWALQAAFSQLSIFFPRQSKCAGSKSLVTLCYIQSAHRNMQNSSQKGRLSPSQILTLVCFNLCSADIMSYLQKKTFSPVIFFFSFFGGEWFLRMSFDIPFPQSLSPSLHHGILSSLSLSLCVSQSFCFFFASFSFPVSGSRPPLHRCKIREVWSVRSALVVLPSLAARPS